jgi:hypothetical protein
MIAESLKSFSDIRQDGISVYKASFVKLQKDAYRAGYEPVIPEFR